MQTIAKRGLNPSWIIVAAGISASLHVGKLPPAVPVLQQELGISLVQAGFLLSTVQVAGMALGLVVGLGADKWGLRRSMLVGLALIALSSMVGAAATGFAWLLALRVLEGMGFLLIAMPAPGLIRRSVQPSELGARMGWWGSYMPVGSAMGLLLGPWVLQATSWQTWWIALGGTSMLAFWAVLRMVPADSAHPLIATTSAHDGWRPRLALTLRSPGPWLVSLSFMLYSGQWMGVIGFLPTLYGQAGLSAKLAGVLTAAVAAANLLGNIASGKLQQRGWSPARCLQTGFVMMGLCALLAYVQIGGEALPLWLRFVAVFLFSATGGLIPATLFTTAMHLAPSSSTVSTTVGLMQQWSCVGQFAGPPLVAAVAVWMGGWQFTWVVTVSMCVLGWLLALGVTQCWTHATDKPALIKDSMQHNS
ncbi:MFS transporter [Comamonas sp. Y33R10-2]|uniref:MFS transporter n=1 Tax=Comamonas sp. Y33R10-2 TaxID=2853257 RepID=UPI001C5C9569|nr:MFS transporter [Comamonas sp. Y33R10-2]QXZ10933.1 MFS transporter [Comamonas sp. Y33R10-2]